MGEVGEFTSRGPLRVHSLVDLCGQDEIALREAIDLVRPSRDLDFSPGEEDVWMMTLFLRKFTYAVYEREGFTKVRKLEGLRDVVLFDNAPAIHLLLQGNEFLTLERRDASPAGYACFSCKVGHTGTILALLLTGIPALQMRLSLGLRC